MMSYYAVINASDRNSQKHSDFLSFVLGNLLNTFTLMYHFTAHMLSIIEN